MIFEHKVQIRMRQQQQQHQQIKTIWFYQNPDKPLGTTNEQTNHQKTKKNVCHIFVSSQQKKN